MTGKNNDCKRSSHPRRRRVVVTGLGAVTPLGKNVTESWANLVEGKSGIETITYLDTRCFTVKFCGSVKNFDSTVHIDPVDAKKMDVFIQYGLSAAVEAIQDSGFQVDECRAHRYGVAIGSGIGGLATIERNYETLLAKGPRRVSPFFIPSASLNMASGWVSMKFNLQGPNFSTSTACATGSHAVALAARIISYGDADVMVAGGAEKGSSALGMAGFAASRALSTRNDAPQQASRPWDAKRDGFVLGDGAGILVLEECEHALARGARIYAEIIGVGMSSDAWHITAPQPDGRGAALSMRAALEDAGICTEDIDYVNAHGTSTIAGDLAETLAIHSVFGESAHRLAVSSTKSMTGHLLGAAGAVEAVFSILSIIHSIAPPTINLEEPGEGCDLDYVAGIARPMTINRVLSNSFGFGGTNVTLAFSKV